MPGLMDYINNWRQMLGGAQQVDPNAQQPQAPSSPLQAAIRQKNPMTGEPRSADYGKDITLPSDENLAKIAKLKQMGYDDATAMKIVYQSNDEKAQIHNAIMQGAPFKPQRNF